MASLVILELRNPYDPNPDTVFFIVLVNLGFGLRYSVGQFSTREAAEEFKRIFEEMEEMDEEIQEQLRKQKLQRDEKEWREFVDLLKKLYEQLWEEILRTFNEKQKPTLAPRP